MDSIDLGRAFKAPFQDKNWVNKTLMGWLWMLLGVTSPAVYGAQLEYIKSVSEGREDLPDWSNFGDKWIKGFLLAVAGFLYFLPVVVGGFIFVIPAVFAGASGSDALGGLAAGGICLFWLFALVYSVAVAIIFYGATVNYAMTGEFGSMFRFGEIMARVRDGSGYFAAWLWAIVVSLAAGVVVSVLSATFVGYIVVPAVYYLSTMITAHLFGQWAARSYRVPAAAPASVGIPGYQPPAAAYAPPAPPAPPSAPAPPAPPVTPEPPVAPTPPVAPAPPVASAPPVAPTPPVAPAPPVAPGFEAPVAPSAPSDGFAAPAPDAPASPEEPVS